MDGFAPAARTAEPASGIAGLAVLAMSTAAELAEVLPPTQLAGFFAAVGRRMAALEPLAGVNDVSVLCARVNAVWHTLGWGEVALSIGPDAIVLRHYNAPLHLEGMPFKAWPDMLLALLEGAYDAWFRSLGSGPALKTTAEWKGDTAELRHGC